jgi:hypothetical protein
MGNSTNSNSRNKQSALVAPSTAATISANTIDNKDKNHKQEQSIIQSHDNNIINNALLDNNKIIINTNSSCSSSSSGLINHTDVSKINPLISGAETYFTASSSSSSSSSGLVYSDAVDNSSNLFSAIKHGNSKLIQDLINDYNNDMNRSVDDKNRSEHDNKCSVNRLLGM